MSRQDVLITWNGEEVKRRAQALIGKSTFAIGMAVMSDAKQLCAVKYGYLAGSIMTAGKKNKKGFEAPSKIPGAEHAPAGHSVASYKEIQPPGSGELFQDEVFVGTAVDYGPYIEYGTVRSSAQPFLRPALDMASGKALTIVKTEGRLAFKEYLQ